MKYHDVALEDALYRRFRNLRRAGGQGSVAGFSAPHKPLLLLILLAEVERTATNRFDYGVLRGRFDELWPRFGWNTTTGKSKVDYPYRYLISDGIWELASDRGVIPAEQLAPPSGAELRKQAPFGQFPAAYWELIRRPEVRRRLAAELLETYIPESQRSELASTLGLKARESLLPPAVLRETALVTRRNPAEQARFRAEILHAYEEKCAVCGFSPRGARAPSAIEAAHIWPVTDNGPSTVENGLALCPLHHWALDSGALGLDADRRIIISSKVIDGETLERYLRAFGGQPIRPPLRRFAPPAERWVTQHREKLFVGPEL